MISKLEQILGFVNDQIEFHQGCAKKYGHNKFREIKHLETAQSFRDLLDWLKSQDNELSRMRTSSTQSNPAHRDTPNQLRLNLMPGDVKGLPDELLQELSVTSSDGAEFAILSILDESPFNIASLDQIIIGLYHSTGEVNKRQSINSRLYRMSQKGLVFQVPNKKGVYSLKLVDESFLAAIAITSENGGKQNPNDDTDTIDPAVSSLVNGQEKASLIDV